MVQAACYQILDAMTRFQSQDTAYDICFGISVTGTGFFQSTTGFPYANTLPLTSHIFSFIYYRRHKSYAIDSVVNYINEESKQSVYVFKAWLFYIVILKKKNWTMLEVKNGYLYCVL
jgi:hypothetical protein